MQEPEYLESVSRRSAGEIKTTIKLMEARRECAESPAREANQLGWYARVLAQVTLPHDDPGDSMLAWARRNGRVALFIQPGVRYGTDGEVRSVGIPFGCIPRLALCVIVSEAVQNNSRTIDLGRSAAEFMRRLHPDKKINRGGSGYKQLREQMDRLLSSRCVLRSDYDGGTSALSYALADEHSLWWDPKRPEQQGIWSSSLTLSERFYEAIRPHPVPIDLRVVHTLSRSPLAIDLYVWLTWRVSFLETPVVIPWAKLAEPIGAAYTRQRDFKRSVKAWLTQIQTAWTTLRAEAKDEGLLLRPSDPHVPKLIA